MQKTLVEASPQGSGRHHRARRRRRFVPTASMIVVGLASTACGSASARPPATTRSSILTLDRIDRCRGDGGRGEDDDAPERLHHGLPPRHGVDGVVDAGGSVRAGGFQRPVGNHHPRAARRAVGTGADDLPAGNGLRQAPAIEPPLAAGAALDLRQLRRHRQIRCQVPPVRRADRIGESGPGPRRAGMGNHQGRPVRPGDLRRGHDPSLPGHGQPRPGVGPCLGPGGRRLRPGHHDGDRGIGGESVHGTGLHPHGRMGRRDRSRHRSPGDAPGGRESGP